MAVRRNNLGSTRTRSDFVLRWFYSIATCVLVSVRYCAKLLRDVAQVWKLWRYKRHFGSKGGYRGQKGAEGSFSTSDIFELVAEDILALNNSLQFLSFLGSCYAGDTCTATIGSDNPILMSAAKHIFGAGGKRIRPALVFLVSRATATIAGLKDLAEGQRKLAEIVEMIHTASLVHDDIIDESDLRRGKKTVHQLYGTRFALLTGDFMFARSTWLLAKLENFEMLKLLSEVIADLVSGEIKQASSLFGCDVKLDEYLLKSYNKTASLIAASTKGAAVLSGGLSSDICDHMYEFGKNLGLSFQVVDDIMDFTQTTQEMGKPAGSDMVNGILTAPVIFALEKETKLRAIIESKFEETGSLDEAVDLVKNSGGIDRARDLAREIADKAVWNLDCLPPSSFRIALERLVEYNLERIK